MIAAAALPGHAFRLRSPTVIPAGSERSRAPTLTADRYVAADGTSLPVAVWPAANGPPKAVILGLHGFGDYRKAWDEPARDLGQGRHHHLFLRPARLRQQPDARPLARHGGPGRRCQGDGRAAARPVSRRAALSRRREHGRRGGAGRRRPGLRGRRADPARHGAALARHVRAGRRPPACGSSPTPSRGFPPARPRSTSSRPTIPRPSRSCSNDPHDAAPGAARHGLWAGRPDGCRARLGRARARALPDAARPGRPHRAAAAGAGGHRGHAAARRFASSPSTRRAITCCCATRKARRWRPTSPPGSPTTRRRCRPAPRRRARSPSSPRCGAPSGAARRLGGLRNEPRRCRCRARRWHRRASACSPC